MARALVEIVIVRYGPYGTQLQILLDLSGNFKDSLFRELCRLLGMVNVRSSSQNLSGSGLEERIRRKQERYAGRDH